ncbi:hypothetical protein D3C73_1453770 [compost metagenome]
MERPLYGNRRVVPADASVTFRCIKLVAFVLDFHIIGQCHKPVSKAFWDQQLLFVIGGELDAKPFSISGAAAAKVNGYIEDRAASTSNELGLGFGVPLKVQPAQGSFFS